MSILTRAVGIVIAAAAAGCMHLAGARRRCPWPSWGRSGGSDCSAARRRWSGQVRRGTLGSVPNGASPEALCRRDRRQAERQHPRARPRRASRRPRRDRQFDPSSRLALQRSSGNAERMPVCRLVSRRRCKEPSGADKPVPRGPSPRSSRSSASCAGCASTTRASTASSAITPRRGSSRRSALTSGYPGAADGAPSQRPPSGRRAARRRLPLRRAVQGRCARPDHRPRLHGGARAGRRGSHTTQGHRGRLGARLRGGRRSRRRAYAAAGARRTPSGASSSRRGAHLLAAGRHRAADRRDRPFIMNPAATRAPRRGGRSRRAWRRATPPTTPATGATARAPTSTATSSSSRCSAGTATSSWCSTTTRC